MGLNRQQLYKEARRVVERRRQRADGMAEQRKKELYAAEPRLAQLDEKQAQAGAAAARFALDGQANKAEEKLAEVRAVRKERTALLKAMGLAEDALQPQYFCVLCGDTGQHTGGVCSCVVDEERRMRREEINGASPLTLCRFENFSVERYPEEMEGLNISPRETMRRMLQYAMDWADEFGSHSESLFMYGDAGLGKTHLALSIASNVLDDGYDVIYVSAQSAFASIGENRYEESPLFASMLQADLLVLDDLGTEYLDAFTRSKLYELINTRMGRRPTIYTSNICNAQALTLRYDEKVSSRLLGECQPMRFWGHDLRRYRG